MNVQKCDNPKHDDLDLEHWFVMCKHRISLFETGP